MRPRFSQAEQTYKLLQRKVKGHPGQLLHTGGESLGRVVDGGGGRVCVQVCVCVKSLSGPFLFVNASVCVCTD